MTDARTIITAGALCLAAVAPSSAHALGDGVIINCRHGELTCADDFSDFISVLQGEGMTVDVVWTDSGMETLSSGDIRLLVVALPFATWGVPIRAQQIPSFLSQGGRMVILGEGETGEPDTNEKIREILDGIPDHGLTLNEDQVNPNAGCGDPPTSMIQGDPLTAGLNEWHIAQTATVSGGDALINFTSSAGGTATLAAVGRLPSGGEVILFGDTEGFRGGLFQDACANGGTDVPAAHEAFWVNLVADQSSAVDADNDGFDSDEDCNDNNPNVNPDATEECNGLDDNCDGTIDEGCDDDDDDTGSDDDDATGSDDDDATGDDDDDSTGAFDDDDSTDPFRDDSGWSSCACGDSSAVASLRPSPWLLSVLPLGGLLGWRRRRSSP